MDESDLKIKNNRAIEIARQCGWTVVLDEAGSRYILSLKKILSNGFEFSEKYEVHEDECIADKLGMAMKNRTARSYCKQNSISVIEFDKWNVLLLLVRAELAKDAEMLNKFRKANCFFESPESA